jgi:hypothetical protein
MPGGAGHCGGRKAKNEADEAQRGWGRGLEAAAEPVSKPVGDLAAGGPLQLQVELEDFPAGDYKLVIADVLRGTLSIISGCAVMTFKMNPASAEQPLDFPTVGQSILITDGSTVLFSGVLPTPPAP